MKFGHLGFRDCVMIFPVLAIDVVAHWRHTKQEGSQRPEYESGISRTILSFIRGV